MVVIIIQIHAVTVYGRHKNHVAGGSGGFVAGTLLENSQIVISQKQTGCGRVGGVV